MSRSGRSENQIPERRRHHRQTVDEVEINTATFIGRVLDVSTRGMAVETTEGLRVGGRYSFRVLVDGLAYLQRGVVRWCSLRRTRPLSNGDVVPVFTAGIRLSGPPATLPGVLPAPIALQTGPPVAIARREPRAEGGTALW